MFEAPMATDLQMVPVAYTVNSLVAPGSTGTRFLPANHPDKTPAMGWQRNTENTVNNYQMNAFPGTCQLEEVKATKEHLPKNTNLAP